MITFATEIDKRMSSNAESICTGLLIEIAHFIYRETLILMAFAFHLCISYG